MKLRLLFLLIPVFLVSCQSSKRPEGSINFNQYQSIIDKEFSSDLNRIKLRYGSFRIKRENIVFHNKKKDSGFFLIDFSSGKQLSENERFVTKINGDGFRDTSYVPGEKFSNLIAGRFVKKGRITVKLFIRNLSDDAYPLFHIHTFSFETPEIESDNINVTDIWLRGMDQINGYFSEIASPFHDYMRMALPFKYKGVPGKYGYRYFSRRGVNTPSIMDILSGKTAIKETFQSGYRKSFNVNEDRNIPVGIIEGIGVKEIPFEKMLKENPRLFETAKLVPFDNMYINIRSFSKAIEFLEFLKKRSVNPGPMESDYRNFNTVSKIVNQMGLEPGNLEKLFGDLLVKNIAVSADDIFFTNGTGISIIYETEKPDMFIENLKKRYSDKSKIKSEKYINSTVFSSTSDDNTGSVHFTNSGNFIIVSNSKASLKRSLDCQSKKLKSMAENYDLKYMRNIYRITDSGEDVFIFMSDPFIRKTLSPRWIIGKMRRITVEEDLKMIASAYLFHRKDTGKKEADIKALVDGKYLVKEALLNNIDDFFIDKESQVPCSKFYGRIGFMRPIGELDIDMVSSSERKVYREFHSFYSKFWEKFFDPIGISIELGSRTKMKTTILPLIDNSIYGALKQFIGGTPVKMNPEMTEDTIFSLGLKINNTEFVRKLEKEIDRKSFYRNKLKRGPLFGNNITINFHDHDLRFLIDHKKIIGNTRLFTRRKSDLYVSLLGSLFNLPVSLSIDLKNPSDFKLNNGLHKLVFALTSSSLFRNNSIGFYSIVPYKGQSILSASLSFYYIKVPIFLSVIDDKLVVASKVSIIEEMLQKRLSAEKTGKKNHGINANAFLHINSKGFSQILPQLRQIFQEKAIESSNAAKIHYSAFIYPGWSKDSSLSDESLKYYGYNYTSFLGENFYHDPLYPSGIRSNKTGFISVPLKLDSDGERIFKEMTLKSSSVNFSFTKHGIETSVIFDN